MEVRSETQEEQISSRLSSMKESIKVTKLDAARRQLLTAITLYFQAADPVSIHTLTCAAFEILVNLGGRASAPPTVYDQIIEAATKLGYEKQVCKALKAPQNFFKHADKDPDDCADFMPDATIFLIYEATKLFQHLSSALPTEFVAIRAWTALKYPQICEGRPEAEIVQMGRNVWSESDRQMFFDDFLMAQEMKKYAG